MIRWYIPPTDVLPVLRKKTPKGYWNDISNQRSFMDELSKKLNITFPEGLYSITCKSLQQNGGGGLLDRYDYSTSKLLQTIYPEYSWDLSKFTVAHNYWNVLSNQQSFMNDLAKKLHITDNTGWYTVTKKSLQLHGGAALLQKYSNSPSKLLKMVYPEYLAMTYHRFTEHIQQIKKWLCMIGRIVQRTVDTITSSIRYQWDHAKFSTRCPRGYWDNPSNQQTFMQQLIEKLNIDERTGLDLITKKTLIDNGGAVILHKFDNSLSRLLSKLFPNYKKRSRDFVMNLMNDLKLSKVEDVMNVPGEYLEIRCRILIINEKSREFEPKVQIPLISR